MLPHAPALRQPCERPSGRAQAEQKRRPIAIQADACPRNIGPKHVHHLSACALFHCNLLPKRRMTIDRWKFALEHLTRLPAPNGATLGMLPKEWHHRPPAELTPPGGFCNPETLGFGVSAFHSGPTQKRAAQRNAPIKPFANASSKTQARAPRRDNAA